MRLLTDVSDYVNMQLLSVVVCNACLHTTDIHDAYSQRHWLSAILRSAGRFARPALTYIGCIVLYVVLSVRR